MIEACVWNEWYPVAVVDDVAPGRQYQSHLLNERISYWCTPDGEFSAQRETSNGSVPCRTQTRYHLHWVSLGDPADDFFQIAEFAEPDRRIVGAGSMRVPTSGLRVVENFLDMAHFPFVHTGLLGEEPHTEVAPYQVHIDTEKDEIIATECRFYQPQAAKSASGGVDADYIYRVLRPFVAVLYKSSPVDSVRLDSIGLFVQPLSDEQCIAHVVLCLIDEDSSDADLRQFQQTIFGQDLMILANHIPRGLPLDQRFEVPTRADGLSAAYRRWLRDKAIRFGTYQTDITQPDTTQPAIP